MDFEVKSGPEIQESELPALEQLVAMGYEYASQAAINAERARYDEVLLHGRLESAIQKLNPWIDEEGIRRAVDQIRESCYAEHLDLVETNQSIRAKLVELSQSGGLDPIVVDYHSEGGSSKKTVRIFDFESAQNNDFLVTNQFQVQGFKSKIFIDVAVFVNGIPLVVIECKDPGRPNAIELAYTENLERYQESGTGHKKLFFYNHCLIASSGVQARVGTVGSGINKYVRWSSSHTMSEEETRQMCGDKYREQERAIAGILAKETLLDHLKNFVIYDIVNGKPVKKIAKHQQYRVVTKAVSRLRQPDIRAKGGVVWHTQGSGKSLSMMWFAWQVRFSLGNLPIVVVTDRRQLDRQIHSTFKQSGFSSPIHAKDSEHLASLLESPQGKTIMTVINKFAAGKRVWTDQRVVCLVDEAHRSNFKINAERMREAMPNGVFFAFTGTPIDKETRNNYRVFGPLIDKYGFTESQEDGSTLPIHYDGRLAELYVENGDTLEKLFDRIIGSDPDVTDEMQEKMKKQYVTREKIAEAPSRIREIAFDIIDHYTRYVEPDGFKAMVVTTSREAAVMYQKEFERMNAPKSDIIMTAEMGESGKDGQRWDRYAQGQEQRADRFKSADDPTKILIVVDMLLVGYDAPIVQTLYLDKGLKEHNLLQAIARVNRRYDKKEFGLVIDYWGVTKELKTALALFDRQDVEGALVHFDDHVRKLKVRHRDLMAHFDKVDRNDASAIVEKFEAEYSREKLEYDFRAFSKELDAVLPGPEAGPYLEDFKFACWARHNLKNVYDCSMPSIREYAKKIQNLIDEYIRAKSTTLIMPQREITGENFLAYIEETSLSNSAKAALIKKRAEAVIMEMEEYNPAYYEGLRERLMRIIDEEKQRRKDNAKYFAENLAGEFASKYAEILREALDEDKKRKDVFGDYPATKFEFAVYEHLKRHKSNQVSSSLTKSIFKKITPETNLVGFKSKPTVKRKVHEIVYTELTEAGMSQNDVDDLTGKIWELVVNRL